MKKCFSVLALLFLILSGCTSSAQSDLEAIQERAQLRDEAQSYYVNYFGIGNGGSSPYQKWQYQQFASVYSTFKAYLIINPNSTETWEDFLVLTDIKTSREQAANLVAQALTLPLDKQRNFINEMGRYLVDDKMGSLFIDLLRSDLLSKYGSGSVVENLCEKIPQMEIEFNGLSGHETMSFLQYLSTKINL